MSAATPAGTQIVNTAALQYDDGGRAGRVSSNDVSLTVAELLDVAITTPAATIPVQRGESVVAVAFTVSNLGNAPETFAIAARTDGAAVVGVAADTNGDGAYDPAVDQSPPDAGVMLAAGQQRSVFVLLRAAEAPTTVTATATATTGHGEPGTVIPVAGQGGGDAVVGRTGATAAASVRIGAGAQTAPSLVKSQTVVAPDGSARVVAGSKVTYSLEARFPGTIASAQVDDPIPAGTRFVAGSMTVDGRPVSDAADDDAGTFDGTAIRVTLGNIAAASNRTIQFTVQIQ